MASLCFHRWNKSCCCTSIDVYTKMGKYTDTCSAAVNFGHIASQCLNLSNDFSLCCGPFFCMKYYEISWRIHEVSIHTYSLAKPRNPSHPESLCLFKACRMTYDAIFPCNRAAMGKEMPRDEPLAPFRTHKKRVIFWTLKSYPLVI